MPRALATKPRIRMQPRRPRGRPRIEDVEALEARILYVAHQSFTHHGYGGTSINEIARLARISKPTLYARFPTKAALFRAIIDQQVAKFVAKQPLPGNLKTLEERLRFHANATLTASLTGDIFQASKLIYSEAGRFPELAEAYRDRIRIAARQIAQLIKEHAAEGGITVRDPDGAAELFNMMLSGWYDSIILTNNPVTSAEQRRYVDRAIKMLMAALPNW